MINKKLERYYKNTKEQFDIPDISSGFIPQGITYDSNTDKFFITGYMGNGSASPIYIIDHASLEFEKKILMSTPEGKDFKGHAGGLSVYKDHLYIAGSTNSCMYSYTINNLLNAKDNSRLAYESVINLKNDSDNIRVSFTSFDNKYLYAGEFHNDPIFQTNKTHNIKTSSGINKAYLLGFGIDKEGQAIPSILYSISDNIQGACFSDEYLFLSSSHGLGNSTIYTFRLNDLHQSGTHNVLGRNIPLYILDESVCLKSETTPPMSEEIVVVDDNLYSITESASNRYLIGKLYNATKVMATPIEFYTK